MVGMRTTRSAAAVVLAATGLLVTGCAGVGGNEPAPAPPAGPSPLVGFDPCTAFSPEELQAQGFDAKGEPVDQGVGEVGCDFESEEILLTLLKAENSDMSYWEGRRASFDEFTPNQVGAHQGIRGVAAGGQGHGVCRQIILSGGGSVVSQVTHSSGTASDPCADAMKIAQQIEPKLPK